MSNAYQVDSKIYMDVATGSETLVLAGTLEVHVPTSGPFLALGMGRNMPTDKLRLDKLSEISGWPTISVNLISILMLYYS